MKGLLFLGLMGAAIYALLVYTHHVLPGGEAEDTFAGQTQPNQPVAQHLSSWGTHLASRSLSQNPQQSVSLPAQQNAPDEPRSNDPSQNSERKPGAWYQLTSEAKAPNSGSESVVSVEWAKVVLAARLHDQASVSSPTVRFYAPGTDLQVVRREGGWLQVSDPVTQERGWVLEKYLVASEGPSSTQAASLESTAEPPSTKAASPKSKKWGRSSKGSKSAIRASNRVARWEPRNVRWARRADRRPFRVFMLGPPF
jgi:Bacterial SH3 domain